ncbi:hypothetical protein GC102_05805 [Paenibacillus sp. LMG 31460]|uniref:DUF4388 domain-containing protein n=1 Tax=Paenibacillus germinis TaxID=2654979 RepID=A0ABX1Z022_9BACL|nr:hypothetical protein [Paenibacillus germinis]NOU85298.1 hypothetical protein [Paenibacillus germinis]
MNRGTGWIVQSLLHLGEPAILELLFDGGIAKLILSRNELRVGSHNLKVVHLHQQEIGVIVTEELGHHLLIDAADSPEMFFLSSLFKHCHETDDVLYLQRESPVNADLFIFNGAATPLNRKLIKEIKMALNRSKSKEKIDLTVESSENETFWDKWESWKYEKQLRIDASKDLVLLNASRLGLELLTHSCAHLASSFAGHSHFNWYSISNSPELIIRNIARND